MNRQSWYQEVTTSLLALLAVIGTFAIISFQLVNDKPVVLPDIVIAYDFSIISFYFGKVASQNGARQSGVAAAQSAVDRIQATQGGTPNAESSSGTP